MTNPINRGSAPNRAQPADWRPRSFKPGHKKQGGRKRGTPNFFTADYKKAILEAAWRVGYDGNGKDGVSGYLRWIGERHKSILYLVLFPALLPLEEAGSKAPKNWGQIREELNRLFADIALDKRAKKRKTQSETQYSVSSTGSDAPTERSQTSEEKEKWIREYIGVDKKGKKRKAQGEMGSPVGWTGQPMPVGGLMELAVDNPKAFCRLYIAAFLRRPAKRSPRPTASALFDEEEDES